MNARNRDREEEVLAQLDEAAASMEFPFWDHGYIAPAGGRLSLFASTSHWAMVIEAVGWSHKADEHTQFQNALYYFGSSGMLRPLDFRARHLCVVDDDPKSPIWNFDGNLNTHLSRVRLRDRPVWATVDAAEYRRRSIELFYGAEVSEPDLLRFLYSAYGYYFLATPAEMTRGLTRRLPLLLQLGEWHHPDILTRPSQSESFRAFARVLSARDPRKYLVRKAPNTDWRNWPDGGRL